MLFLSRPLGDDYVYAYLHNDDATDTATPPPAVVPLRKNDKRHQDTGNGEIIRIIEYMYMGLLKNMSNFVTRLPGDAEKLPRGTDLSLPQTVIMNSFSRLFSFAVTNHSE